jgi:hypothetical protein
MRKPLLLFALSTALVACVDDPAVPTPETPAIQGIWRFTETMSAAARQTSCASTSSVTLRGDDNTFSGSYWQSGYCADQFAIFDNTVEGVIKAGRINGNVVSWNDSGCSYVGRIQRNRMRGTVSCTIEEDGETYLFRGEWSATR